MRVIFAVLARDYREGADGTHDIVGVFLGGDSATFPFALPRCQLIIGLVPDLADIGDATPIGFSMIFPDQAEDDPGEARHTRTVRLGPEWPEDLGFIYRVELTGTIIHSPGDHQFKIYVAGEHVATIVFPVKRRAPSPDKPRPRIEDEPPPDR